MAIGAAEIRPGIVNGRLLSIGEIVVNGVCLRNPQNRFLP